MFYKLTGGGLMKISFKYTYAKGKYISLAINIQWGKLVFNTKGFSNAVIRGKVKGGPTHPLEKLVASWDNKV